MSEQNGYENYNEDYAYQTVMRNGRPKTRVWSVFSMVFGILSVVCCCLTYVALVFGILALVFAVVSRTRLGYFDGMAIAGLVLGVFGTVIGFSFAILPFLIPDEALTKYLQDFLDGYYQSLEGVEGMQ
ncbi:MAG: DUF4190 domain-containing protein [Clostridia bacterium]|nr:DUF4190 domain-containing protein [Clostridia bacterium]